VGGRVCGGGPAVFVFAAGASWVKGRGVEARPFQGSRINL